MIIACNHAGIPVLADHSKEFADKEFTCPECKKKVLLVIPIAKRRDGEIRIAHFRHKVKAECDPEPETQEHIQMKMYMMEKLDLTIKDVEVRLGFAKPDLYFESEGKKYAIEVQHSPLTLKKFIERNKKFHEGGVNVLWIFHADLLLEKSDRERIFRPSAMLKKAHTMYFGRVYVFENYRIFPVHFGFHRKTFRRIETGGEIYSFNLSGVTSQWGGEIYSLARFNDKKFWVNTYAKNTISG